MLRRIYGGKTAPFMENLLLRKIYGRKDSSLLYPFHYYGRSTSATRSSSSSFSGSPPKSDGRTIFYAIAEADGTVDNSVERSFSFKGTSVAELTEKLEEETVLSGIVVCSRNPLNGQLCPLRLHLPPNNSTMHVVVLQASSKHQSAC